MRAAIAVAAFAVAVNAVAIPAGELAVRAEIGAGGINPENQPTSGGLNPNARPGTGGSSPGTGGSSPGTGGSSPGTGGSSPGTGGSSPGTGGSSPGTGGSSPGTGGSSPGTGGSSPGTGGSSPGTGGSSPGTGGSSPGTGGSSPGGGPGSHHPGGPGSHHPGGPGGSDVYPPSHNDDYPSHDDDYDNYHKPSNYDQDTTYTPHYPSGGYKAPEQYPADCVYSKPHYPPPPKDCDYGKTKGYPYPDNYPAKDNYGQHDNYGNDYKPHGYEAPKGYAVYSPRHGQPVTCGKKHRFEWHGFKGKQVKLELVYGKGGDDCHHYTTISDSCDNSGHYEWDVPTDIPPTGGLYGYGLKVTCHDTGDVYYSPQFCFDNKDFYNEYKHPACPTAAPQPVVVPPCTECQAPPPPPAQTQAPVAPTPCPTDVAVPAATGNSTVPTYESGASGVKQSMSFIAALAALVAFAL